MLLTTIGGYMLDEPTVIHVHKGECVHLGFATRARNTGQNNKAVGKIFARFAVSLATTL